METLFGISPHELGSHSLWFALGYMLGSIPFGVIIARAFGLGDLRKIGSGNIGATNVLRTGNKGAAVATLLLDALKGTLPVALAMYAATESAALAAAFGAFLGHIFPYWLKFRGGKGVATYVGILLGLGWPFLLVFAISWLSLVAIFRYSSLAALVTSVIVTLYAAYTGATNLTFGLAAMTVIIFLTHRANISRLLKGQESRVGAKE